MSDDTTTRRSAGRNLGTALLIAGVALVGWVGLKSWERERARNDARAELEARSSRAALAVAPAPHWDPDRVGGAGLELPTTAPTFAREPRPVLASNRSSSKLIGRIVAPDVGVDAPAFRGIDMKTLDLGAGHFPGTPLPGARGNSSFAGHRNTDFKGLRYIEVGHTIYVEMGEATHVYRVSETRVVEPSQVDVVGPRGRDELTLVTCHPFDWVGPAPRRFIVHADFVETRAGGEAG